MNNTEEESILERFKANYNLFPNGEIEHCDKPDFIVHGVNKIGIELTQVFQDQESNKGSTLRAREEYKRKILEDLVELLNNSKLRQSVVSISLKNLHLSISPQPKAIAKECFKDIKSRFGEKQFENHITYTIENIGHLPDLVESYDIWFDSNLSNPEYVETAGSVGKTITNEVLQFILDKKENALQNYTPCDIYWLVIKEGAFASDYFPKIEVEPTSLVTSFDKIFVLRHSSPPIVELL